MSKETAKADFATSKTPNTLAADRSTKTDEANKAAPTKAKKAAPAKAKAAPKAEPKPVAPPSPEERTADPVVHAAYEQGRAARRARIARDDAPHGDGRELEAWRKGYDFEEKHGG